MTKANPPRKLNPKTIWAIRGYVQRGYSANKIQVKLRSQHLGIRRKMLLAEVRRVKGQPLKAEIVKYIPKKYVRARWRARAKRPRLRPLGEKQVTITGEHDGELVSKTRRGKGKDLYNWILDEMTGGYWDKKPTVHY